MKYKIVPNFFLVIIAIIVGAGLFNLFDFQEMKVDKPALAVVYGTVFMASIRFMIKKSKK